jgi:predicted PurR-regulated permease PerM
VTVDGPTRGASVLGTRERRWLIAFLALGSAYFALLLADRILSVLGGFSQILLILFLAWLLAFVMAPVVGVLQVRLNLPRSIVTALVYSVALVMLGFLVFYTGSAITQQVGELAENYPATERDILATLATWQESLDFGRLEIDLVGLYRSAAAEVESIGGTLVELAQTIAGVTIVAVGSLLLIVILSLYMVMDSARILGRLKQLVPRRYQDEVDLFERSVARAFGGFLRAQLILAAVQALLVSVVGVAFSIPYLFLIGTLSALAMLIPFFGPPLALIPPIAAAAIFSPGAFVPVAVILIVVQTVLVNWLQPRLMQGALGLHPILVLVGLLLGAQVAGVWGALFGIPVIAVLWVFASYFLFRAVPNVALPDRERLEDVQEHTLVAVEKEQIGDETHPHIHVTRSRRADGTEEVHLDFGDQPTPARRPDEGDATA